jgi:hypothetical protein
MSNSSGSDFNSWTLAPGIAPCDEKAKEECHGLSRPFPLNIWVLGKETFQIAYKPTMTIKDLKVRIQEVSGISPENQRIMSPNGIQIQDKNDATLETLDIKRGNTVLVMAKK